LSGVRPVIFKGTALAYTIYEKPELRPRCDSDLFIKTEDREQVAEVMKDLGYAKIPSNDGDLISYQFSFTKTDSAGIDHVFDFHWRVSNPQLFSKVLSCDDLRAGAVPIPSLSLHSLGPNTAHSLLIACIHRVAHHHDLQNFLWLFDIHLLCARKTEAWFEEFAALACERGVAAVCARGLSLAEDVFATSLPEFLIPALDARFEREETARYLIAKRRWYRDLWLDLAQFGSNRERAKFLLQHAFPPAVFLLDKYDASDMRLVPLLYVRRAFGGVGRLLKRRASFFLNDNEN
jgi:hypothetical protein